MLCPKGVKRYLQQAHPDRLLHRLRAHGRRAERLPPHRLRRRDRPRRLRDRAHPGRARPRRLRRPLGRQPDDREGVPDGQVRPHVPADGEHRLQRPALHGERGGGQQEGVRHRPRGQPLERHPRRRGRLGRGGERRRVRADHDRLHLAGARARRQDHRRRPAHHPARAHLRPVPAGQAGPRHGALQRHPAPDDRERLDRSRLHRARTRSASTRWRPRSRAWTPARTAEVTGIAEQPIQQAAEWWGTARTSFLLHARGIEHHSHGVQNVLSAINIVLASGRIGRPSLRLRDDHRPGQRPGRTRARPEVRPAPRRARPRQPRAPRVRRGRLGHVARRPAAARRRRVRDHPQDRPRRDPRAAEHLLQPGRLAARQQLRPPGAREARLLRRDRLLPERDGALRRRRAARLAPGGGRGHGDADRGPGRQDQQGGRLSGRRPPGLADHPGHRARPGPRARLHLPERRRDLRRAAGRVGRAA